MAKKDWLQKGIDGLTFGERLDDLIKDNGIKAAQLAKDTKIPQSAISEYINGKQSDSGTTYRAPDCATIIALSKFFSVSADYLLGLTSVKSTNEDVKTVCAVTGLQDDNIYDLMGLTHPEEAVFLREMVNEFLDYAVTDRGIATYIAFRKYIALDNQRWKAMDQMSQEEYDKKAEEMRKFATDAEQHGYLIMSYNEAAEKQWKELQEEYGNFLLKRYRSFDKQADPEELKEALNGND